MKGDFRLDLCRFKLYLNAVYKVASKCMAKAGEELDDWLKSKEGDYR